VTLIGIDGCRGGWVLATATERSNVSLSFSIVSEIGGVFAQASEGKAIIAIDVPIGLPASGSRACDLAARRALGRGQGSRVFPAPSRAALAGASYAECCELNRKASGVKISRQTFAIFPKIREVDGSITPPLQAWIREAHPEVSFSVLNGPLQYSKKRAVGRKERLAILAQHGILFDAVEERARLGRARVAVDDLIDAAACLVTARRIHDGATRLLGGGDADARGIRMEIIA
jgi:predicted RNase H-like nuclease